MTRIITSPERIMLSHANQSKKLGVMVQNEAGHTIPDAAVTWRSSNPDVIQVTQDGHVTALADVGYAVLTVSYGDVFQQVPVTVVKLAQGSRILEESQVRSVSETGDQAVLVLNDDTASLRVGEIIISEAVFGRLTHLEVRGREIHVRIEMVPLPEVFSEIYIKAVSKVEVELTASSEGVSISTPGALGREPVSFGGGISPLFMSLPNLPTLPHLWGCEVGTAGQLDRLEIERGEITWTCTFTCTFIYALSLFAPPTMEIGVTHSIAYDRASDNIKFKPGIEFSGSCFLKVGPIPTLPIWIPGTPFFVTFFATPKVGIELSVTPGLLAEFTGPSIAGSSITYRAGLTYAGGAWTGFAVVDSFSMGTTVPGELVSLQGQLETNLGPFAAASISIGFGGFLDLGLVEVEFLKPKTYITWKHKMITPLDRFHIDYKGPQWKIVHGAKTWLGLKLVGKVKTVFGKLGIFVGYNAHNFVHFENEWVQSPKPTISTQSSDLPYSIGLRVDITHEGTPYVLTNLYQGWAVDFIAIRQGESIGEIVGSAQLNAAGEATFFWDMFDYPPGDYTVRTYIRNPNWFLSQIFPYASNNAVDVTVVEPQATIEITSPVALTVSPGIRLARVGPPAPSSPVSVSAGLLEFEADYHYPFDSIDLVKIQWSVNDTLIDTQSVQGLDGTSRVRICLLPPDATVEARINRTGRGVLASDVMQLAVFPTDAIPVGTTECGDIEGSVLLAYDAAAEWLREIMWLLQLISRLRLPLDDPRPPLGDLPLRHAIPLFQTNITGAFRRSFDRLKIIGSRAKAIRAINEMLSEALNRQSLSGDVLRQPREQIMRQLSSRYSDEFISYLDDLFRVVDAQNIERGIQEFRNLAQDVLNRDDWSDEEGELILNTVFLVATTIDYFAPKQKGGREAWSMIRFNRDPLSLAGRVNSLIPPRAALNTYLGVLAANPRIDVGPSFEISQLMATLTAVNIIRG
jgi:hypothetical protein